jgi:hypothetical protein
VDVAELVDERINGSLQMQLRYGLSSLLAVTT